MPYASSHPPWRRALAALALASASAIASAAPYATTYSGTISYVGLAPSQHFAEIQEGQRYTLTLVFDNGGSSANSQTWVGSHLTCAIFRFNDASNVVFAQDLVTGPAASSGTVVTDGAGALTSVFSLVESDPVPAGSYTATGIALTPDVHWWANSIQNVFSDDQGGTYGRIVNDPNVGIPMTIANWSAPQPFSGACDAPPPPPPAAVTPVPTLGEWSLALLGLLAAGLGARRLRRRG